MRNLRPFLCLALLPLAVAGASSSRGVAVVHLSRVIQGAQLDIIESNLRDPGIKADVVVADGFPGVDQPFGEMLAKPGVLAAVNGAYFDKDTKKPIGDIWSHGQLLNFGAMGTALGIRKDGTMEIRRVRRSHHTDWSEFETVLACGPALVIDGKIDCHWADEGFRDPHVTGKAVRMGVGYTTDGRLLMVMCRNVVTFDEFAGIMKELGCQGAMNLDAGASLAMWFKGRTIHQASRRLTNILVIRTR